MQTLDTALRLMLIGQLMLVAMVIIMRGHRSVWLPLVLFKVSVIAFLIKSSPPLAQAMAFAQIPLVFGAMASPYLVWWVANVLFDFEKPPLWVMIVLPVSTVAMCGYEAISAAPLFLRVASMTTSLVVVLHALFMILRGNLDDLSEPRRSFRLCFAACITSVTVVVLFLELLFIGQPDPVWMPITNTLIIAFATLLTCVSLLNRPEDLIPGAAQDDEPDTALAVADQELHKELLTAMGNRAYARTGLTIRQLSEELQTPEHQLRRLINSHLGFKNFSTFLNGYRIEETCERLTDPKEARVPILTIALDAGFASLAPFNRAFRAEKDMTPSEFRRQHLKSSNVVRPLRA